MNVSLSFEQELGLQTVFDQGMASPSELLAFNGLSFIIRKDRMVTAGVIRVIGF